MDYLEISFSALSPPVPLRVTGTVTDPAGNPLVRRVILYDESGAVRAETWSAPDGTATFDLAGANRNNRYIVRAMGNSNECDDISCPMQGAP